METLNLHRLMFRKSCPLGFLLVLFLVSAVLFVHVPLPFDVYGRMWNSIVSVPDHCLFIYFIMGKRKLALLLFHCRYFDESVLNMFVVLSSAKHILFFFQTFQFDSLSW